MTWQINEWPTEHSWQGFSLYIQRHLECQCQTHTFVSGLFCVCVCVYVCVQYVHTCVYLYRTFVVWYAGVHVFKSVFWQRAPFVFFVLLVFFFLFSSKLYICMKLTLVSYAALEHKIRSLHSWFMSLLVCESLLLWHSVDGHSGHLEAGPFQAGSLALNTHKTTNVCTHVRVCVWVCLEGDRSSGLLCHPVADTLLHSDRRVICVVWKEEKPIHLPSSLADQILSHDRLFRLIVVFGG